MMHCPSSSGYGVEPHVDQRLMRSKAVIRVNRHHAMTETHFAPCKQFLWFWSTANRKGGNPLAGGTFLRGRNAQNHRGLNAVCTITASASNTSPFSLNLRLFETKSEGLKHRSGAAFRLTETRKNCSAQSNADKGA
jgi:hypothetical protein